MDLRERIEKRTARVCVIGLGYVGLPLAVAFAAARVRTTGIDIDPEKVDKITRGVSYIPDVPSDALAHLVHSGLLSATGDPAVLRTSDAVLICVPTPFTKAKVPDLSSVEEATESVRDHLHPGELVILQSTTYPGTTEEVLLPLLESTGLRAGQDFFLAFSPERIDPGNTTYTVRNTPRVVGGHTPEATELAARLFALFLDPALIHRVSSPRAAEMCKLLENIFRSVNIALVNEMVKLCNRMRIDIWEIIDAAATKPFGFMPFYPGPGVGGHCIPVDPYYLSWKAREFNTYTKFIELAAEVNESMPFYTVNRIAGALNQKGKPLKGSKILVLGAAFKRDSDDARNSPAVDILRILASHEAEVFYNDPYVAKLPEETATYPKPIGHALESVPLTEALLREMDCVVLAVRHSRYDLPWIVAHSALIVDTQNATKGIPPGKTVIVKL